MSIQRCKCDICVLQICCVTGIIQLFFSHQGNFFNPCLVRFKYLNGNFFPCPVCVNSISCSHWGTFRLFFFQNALRAVVEHHGDVDVLPKVHVLVCKGKEDLTIKVPCPVVATNICIVITIFVQNLPFHAFLKRRLSRQSSGNMLKTSQDALLLTSTLVFRWRRPLLVKTGWVFARLDAAPVLLLFLYAMWCHNKNHAGVWCNSLLGCRVQRNTLHSVKGDFSKAALEGNLTHDVVFSFQISDQGGGISKGKIDQLFHYMYSTAPRPPSPQASSVTPLVSTAVSLQRGAWESTAHKAVQQNPWMRHTRGRNLICIQ